MKLSVKSPSDRIWIWVVGHVLFWCSPEVHGSLVMLLFWGHVLRTVGFLFDLFWVPGLFCERPWQGSLGTCVGLLFELFGRLPPSGGKPWKGFLLTCLGC